MDINCNIHCFGYNQFFQCMSKCSQFRKNILFSQIWFLYTKVALFHKRRRSFIIKKRRPNLTMLYCLFSAFTLFIIMPLLTFTEIKIQSYSSKNKIWQYLNIYAEVFYEVLLCFLLGLISIRYFIFVY